MKKYKTEWPEAPRDGEHVHFLVSYRILSILAKQAQCSMLKTENTEMQENKEMEGSISAREKGAWAMFSTDLQLSLMCPRRAVMFTFVLWM